MSLFSLYTMLADVDLLDIMLISRLFIISKIKTKYQCSCFCIAAVICTKNIPNIIFLPLER